MISQHPGEWIELTGGQMGEVLVVGVMGGLSIMKTAWEHDHPGRCVAGFMLAFWAGLALLIYHTT